MTVLKVIQIEEKPKLTAAQWSIGLAMFAAFVAPFVLLSTSARYRMLIAQAKAKIVVPGRWHPKLQPVLKQPQPTQPASPASIPQPNVDQ